MEIVDVFGGKEKYIEAVEELEMNYMQVRRKNYGNRKYIKKTTRYHEK